MMPAGAGGVNDVAKSEDDEIANVQLCLIWVYIMNISSKVCTTYSEHSKPDLFGL